MAGRYVESFLVLLLLAVLHVTEAQTGVCYGRLGSALPPPREVISLFKQNNIRRMRLYDPYDKAVLQALGGSGIELMLGLPNNDLESIASSQANANRWVQENVRSYPDVRFKYIAVGNEVTPLNGATSRYVSFVFPAMRNVQNAINAAGLGNQIKVSTSVETGLTTNTYPPSKGEFRSEVRRYLDPIIQFLVNNGAPLLVNIYPYFALAGNPGIGLDYSLFRSAHVVPDGVKYQGLFLAMLDATYAALEKVGASSVRIVVSETGWPTKGGHETTTENARIYNSNLIQAVKSGSPKRPGKPIEAYIFAMFDENQKKGDEVERNFGLFSPNKRPKYSISFN